MYGLGLKLKEVALGRSLACRVRMPWPVPQPSARGATCSVALWSWQRLQLSGHLVASPTIMMPSLFLMGPRRFSKKTFIIAIYSHPLARENDQWDECWQVGPASALSALCLLVTWPLISSSLCSPHFRIRSLVNALVSTRGAERGYLEDTHQILQYGVTSGKGEGRGHIPTITLFRYHQLKVSHCC